MAMDARIRELLKPEILNTVTGLELVARVVVEGFMSGANKSLAIGIGQEFSQYRNYEPGDDLRQLDWKMYARSERYYIKQAEIETNITVKFMIDASHSMAYEEQHISKLQYARLLTAALAYLARRQGDTFGLFGINNKHITSLPPRFEQQQFMRFLHDLVTMNAESTWSKQNLDNILDHHGKEIIIFMTDLYDDNSDLLQFISRLKTPRNEVILFHILGHHETEMDFGGSFTFRDLETNAVLKVDTNAQQKQYTTRIKEWIAQCRAVLLEKNISYNLVILNEDPGQVLRNFLKVRKTLAG